PPMTRSSRLRRRSRGRSAFAPESLTASRYDASLRPPNPATPGAEASGRDGIDPLTDGIRNAAAAASAKAPDPQPRVRAGSFGTSAQEVRPGPESRTDQSGSARAGSRVETAVKVRDSPSASTSTVSPSPISPESSLTASG